MNVHSQNADKYSNTKTSIYIIMLPFAVYIVYIFYMYIYSLYNYIVPVTDVNDSFAHTSFSLVIAITLAQIPHFEGSPACLIDFGNLLLSKHLAKYCPSQVFWRVSNQN